MDTIIGIIGIAVTIYAFYDNRKQRNKREQAVSATVSLIDRLNGLLIGIKPAITNIPAAIDAINDGLEAIQKERNNIKSL